MATDEDRSTRSTSLPDDGFYSTSRGAHHFGDNSQTSDNSAYPPWADPPSHLDDGERAPLRWNGGADLGLLVLRLALGGAFIVHGLQKVFGLFGGSGIDGFATFLQELGFREARPLAWVAGVAELGGGTLLVLGLFTPLAAAGILGVMVNAIVVKWGGGFLGARGVELEVAFAAMAFAVLFTGPGRASLDNGRSWFRHPLPSGFILLVVAAAATAVTLFVFR